MTNTLEGKVVVVTGAGGRLGQRMVDGFAQTGAAVVAVDRHPDPGGVAEDAPGRAYRADLATEAAAALCLRQIAEACGRIDALVHTVGTWAGQPLLETRLDDWDRLMRLNLTTTFLCFREAARHMEAGGRLIGFASGQGADRGRAEQGAYSAAKAGVIRLVEAAAEELEAAGITAHALAPSTILYDDEDRDGVRASDLVDLARTLCTPAGRALSGATLRVYGG